jgi:hypothetical protein
LPPKLRRIALATSPEQYQDDQIESPGCNAQGRRAAHRWCRRPGGVTIELREIEIDALIRSGFLEKHSRNDSYAVILALYRVFDRVFCETRTVTRTR